MPYQWNLYQCKPSKGNVNAELCLHYFRCWFCVLKVTLGLKFWPSAMQGNTTVLLPSMSKLESSTFIFDNGNRCLFLGWMTNWWKLVPFVIEISCQYFGGFLSLLDFYVHKTITQPTIALRSLLSSFDVAPFRTYFISGYNVAVVCMLDYPFCNVVFFNFGSFHFSLHIFVQAIKLSSFFLSSRIIICHIECCNSSTVVQILGYFGKLSIWNYPHIFSRWWFLDWYWHTVR